MLVQRSQVRNPLTGFFTDDRNDPTTTFHDIIMSTATIGQLMDSLGLTSSIASEIERRQLVEQLRGCISSRVSEDESITISFMDDDPVRAQRGVLALTNIFVAIGSGVKDKQNEMMVAFYEQKVREFREKFEQSQARILPTIGEQIKKNTSATASTKKIDQQMEDLDKKLKELKTGLDMIKNFDMNDLATKEGRQTLYELQRLDIPFALEIRNALTHFADMSERYTAKHPDVAKATSDIRELLETIQLSAQREVNKLNADLLNLREQRTELVNGMIRQSVLEQEEKDKEQNYALYQRLYTEMKARLEEAQTTTAISKNTNYRFVVLDPAYLPLFPSKPRRAVIILGGFGAGIVIGIILMLVAELIDTRISSPRQIAVYDKPIIGLLPEARRQDAH
jgi:uncharacterized protein involved in exopolysaccharide biosynthesis